eukprot:1183544-Prorocentrum_minimum.AAC.1
MGVLERLAENKTHTAQRASAPLLGAHAALARLPQHGKTGNPDHSDIQLGHLTIQYIRPGLPTS